MGTRSVCFLLGARGWPLGDAVHDHAPDAPAMDGRDFRNFMEAFLRYAGQSWGKVYNYAWSLGMGIGPIVALVLLWDDPGSTSFVLTAIGLGIVLVGMLARLQRVEDPDLQRDLGLGSRGDASGLGGGTAALLHDQLDPVRDDLGGVRPVPGGSDLPLGGPAPSGVERASGPATMRLLHSRLVPSLERSFRITALAEATSSAGLGSSPRT